MAVADLATTYAALRLSLTRREGREVVVEQEALVALVQYVIDHLFVKACAERSRSQGLRFATREDGRAVRHRQRAGFAPDGADLGRLATI